MPFKTTPLRFAILVAFAAFLLTLAVNFGYGLACLTWCGLPLAESLREMQTGTPYLVLGLFLAAVGAILGSRLGARGSAKSPARTGLAVGTGLSLVVLAVGWARGLDFWLPPNALMAAIGGWLGGLAAIVERPL